MKFLVVALFVIGIYSLSYFGVCVVVKALSICFGFVFHMETCNRNLDCMFAIALDNFSG